MTHQPEPGDRARALGLLEAAEFMRDAHFRDGLTVQEITTALAHTVDRADAMVGSLARDGFGAVEIAEMLSADAPAVSSAVVAPPTDQAAEILRVVEAALGDTLVASARAEALAGITAVLTAHTPTDQAAPSHRAELREQIAAAIWERQNPGRRWADCEYRWRADAEADTDAVLAVLYREWPWLRAETEDAASADQAAQWRAAADVVEAMNEGCGQRKPCASCDAREDAADALRDTARRLAADEQPGVRHVHITIRHPDPTTARTAALCIADLIRGEYGDSLHLAITTDAQDTGGSPRRLADETPDTTADTFAGGSYLTAEHDTLGMIAARHGGDRLAWEMANPWVTSSAMVLPAGLRVAIPAQAGPAAGARQDGAQQ